MVTKTFVRLATSKRVWDGNNKNINSADVNTQQMSTYGVCHGGVGVGNRGRFPIGEVTRSGEKKKSILVANCSHTA